MRVSKKLSIILAAALAVSCLAACSSNNKQTDGGGGQLSYWMPLDTGSAMTVTEYGETPFAQEWQKRTNTQLKFIHPPQGQSSEKFSIMIASGDLPDIVEYTWNSYPGGADKAVKDGFVVQLNDKMEANSPAFYKFLKENPEIDKAVKTDSGAYTGYPGIMGDESLAVSAGLFLRKDWLDDLSLPIPETIDEWEKTLIAFRDQKGAKAPLSVQYTNFNWQIFVGAYGIGNGMYVDDGVIKFGPMQPEYKEFITKMNQWYTEGLLDKNIASLDSATANANILNGVSGASANSLGGGLGKLLAAAPDEKFDLAAAPYPVLTKGTKPEFGHSVSRVQVTSAAITTDCADVDAAMKFLDYGYTDEGRMLFNFGIEGESYEMIDGYPTYTSKITKDAEGLPMQATLARYTRAGNGALGSIQDKRYMEQYAALPQQQNAWAAWSNTNAAEHLLPAFYPTEEESEVYAKLVTAVDSYNSEMVLKFIMGVTPISNYDAYLAELKARGVEEIVKIHQNAYERYLAR